MVVRIVLATVLSAVAMFFWGFLFWGVLNVGGKLMQPLPNDLDVLAALRNAQTPSGMYLYPMPPADSNEESVESFQASHEEGPLLQLAYQAEGGPPMPPAQLVLGFGHSLVVAFATSLLVAIAAQGLTSFGSRFAVVMLVSLVSAIWANGGDAIWWFHSTRYSLGNSLYQLGAGVCMALVIAAIVRRPPAEATTQT